MDSLDQFASVEELTAHVAELRGKLQEMDAAHAGKQFPAEQRSVWTTINSEIDAATERIDELTARAKRLSDLAEKQPAPAEERIGSFTPIIKSDALSGEQIYDLSTVRATGGWDGPEEMARQYRDRAMKAIENGNYGGEDVETRQAAAERTLKRADDENGTLARQFLVTGSPTYERAFFKTLAGRPLTSDEARAMSIGSGSAGGYLLPFTLDPTVILTSDGALNPIRQIARVEQITTNTWKGVTGTGGSARYTTEAAQATDNSPTLAQPVVDAIRADYFVPFSVELDQDWNQLRSELNVLVTDAKDVLEADKFLTGAGSTEPQGLLVGATAVVSTAATATLAVGDVYKPKDALPPRFRGRGVFVANGSIYSKIRQLDTSGGGALWVQLGGDNPDRLLGYPDYQWENMAATTGSGATMLTFGDFSKYLIVDRVGMSAEIVPHLFGGTGTTHYPTGQRGFYALWRNSATVLAWQAFRSLKSL